MGMPLTYVPYWVDYSYYTVVFLACMDCIYSGSCEYGFLVSVFLSTWIGDEMKMLFMFLKRPNSMESVMMGAEQPISFIDSLAFHLIATAAVVHRRCGLVHFGPCSLMTLQ